MDLYLIFSGKIVPPDLPFVEIYISGLGSSSSKFIFSPGSRPLPIKAFIFTLEFFRVCSPVQGVADRNLASLASLIPSLSVAVTKIPS